MKLVDRGMLLVLVAIFLFSGVDKILHYDGFLNALRNYVVVPRGTAPYFAIPVIAVELMIGVGLLIPAWRRAAALTAAAILAVFTVALGLNHLYGGRGICGCWFTLTLAKSTGMHVLQNLLLLGLSLSIWWTERAGSPAAALAPNGVSETQTLGPAKP